MWLLPRRFGIGRRRLDCSISTWPRIVCGPPFRRLRGSGAARSAVITVNKNDWQPGGPATDYPISLDMVFRPSIDHRPSCSGIGAQERGACRNPNAAMINKNVRRSLSFRPLDDQQAEVLGHWLEVAVIVQKLMLSLNAKCANNQVDRLAHRKSLRAQSTIIPGCLDRGSLVQH